MRASIPKRRDRRMMLPQTIFSKITSTSFFGCLSLSLFLAALSSLSLFRLLPLLKVISLSPPSSEDCFFSPPPFLTSKDLLDKSQYFESCSHTSSDFGPILNLTLSWWDLLWSPEQFPEVEIFPVDLLRVISPELQYQCSQLHPFGRVTPCDSRLVRLFILLIFY